MSVPALVQKSLPADCLSAARGRLQEYQALPGSCARVTFDGNYATNLLWNFLLLDTTRLVYDTWGYRYLVRRVSHHKTLLTFDLKQIEGPELSQEMIRNTVTLLQANLETRKHQCKKGKSYFRREGT